MAHSKQKIAGTLLLTAAAQFLPAITIAEALHPGFSVHDNYISDLGIGPSAAIFNTSAILLGLLTLTATYQLRHNPNYKTLNKLLILTAIGAIGIGIFTKHYTTAHGAVATTAFFFAGLSAITSSKTQKKPLSHISTILGIMTLAALALFSAGMVTSGSLTSDIAYDSNFYLGLGPGGMEHIIIYPALIWLTTFSAHLLTQQETPAKQ